MIFDVSTDRGIRTGNQTLTEIMYGLFLQSLGYAKDLDSRSSRSASREGGSTRSRQHTSELSTRTGTPRRARSRSPSSEASRVMHSLDPDTYPMADSWVKARQEPRRHHAGQAGGAGHGADEAPAARARSLMFVVDEVGQFVARDVQKMLDLQAVVQSLGVRGAASTGSSSPRRRSSASSSAASTTRRSSWPA